MSATLYFKNSGDPAWENILNWFEDAGATIPASSVPWTQDDAYKDFDLTYATDETGAPFIGAGVEIGHGFVITGTCDFSGLSILGTIYGGTFSGGTVTLTRSGPDNGAVNGGTFTGNAFSNTYPENTVNGGVFTGDGFTNGGVIHGGTFTGAAFTDNGAIYAGLFTGAGFVKNGSLGIYGGVFGGVGFSNYDIIYGGTFSGEGLYNNGPIRAGSFSGSGFYNALNIFGGEFTLNGAVNGGTIYNGVFGGESLANYGTVNGGVFSVGEFVNSGVINGGAWLERGTALADGLRIVGLRVPNPYPVAGCSGFSSVSIPGQDVIGSGLL